MKSEIPIIFRDEHIVVVDKPVGISVHNTEGENLLEILQPVLAVSKLYPVHRLDKETSGIQILALDDRAAGEWGTEFQERSVRKIYVGIVRGKMTDHEGVWNKPITDKAEGRVNPQGQAKDRVESETRFKVIRQNSYFTLCEFNLVTGRQHQIRKHAALAKHALVGDKRYGDGKYNERMAKLYGEPRMFLHCSRLEIRGHTFETTIPKAYCLLLPED